ncbi:hypothetical protein [Halobacterium bonnevillei]|uniref:Uncharacterized protein n=1 Tax=Halobacterium bonnevillei TaxID=2692200 RepID=A0A6B0SI48_9EURY|nr:hypothetical protein [Halobacterium bonnevillei]MXR20226.1 hypothetical protein [Halobacterium bonnevillei]
MFGQRTGFFQEAITLFLAAAAITFVTDWLFATIIVDEYLLINTVVAVAVVLGVLFGPSAAAGVGVGSVITDVLRLTVGPETLFVSLTFLGVGVLCHIFIQDNIEWFGSEIRIKSVLKLFAAVLLAALFAASFYAWSQELLGRFPFYPTFVFTAISYLLGALVAIPFVLIGIRSEQLPKGRQIVSTKIDPLSWWVVTITVLWPVLALIGSLGFRIRERIETPFIFRRLGIEFVYEFVSPAVFAQGGRRAQVLLGAIVLTVVGYRFVWLHKTGGEVSQ